MNVFLLGMPGSGKTTAGKKIARKLKLDFFDLDQLIEEKCRLSINEIFSSNGEDFFRLKEAENLQSFVQSNKNFLLSLGGGTPCYFENLKLILQSGISVYLKSTPESLTQRILQGQKNRPLFEGLDKLQVLKKTEQLLKEREHFYLQANICVNAVNLDANSIAEEIRNKFQ